MNIKKIALATIITASIAATSAAIAQNAAPAAPPTLVKPVPLVQEGRFFPGFGNEGLVTARYTVKADGTTGDIEILDGGFTNPFYENTIKQTIAKWTFTPGTVNGEAKDFFNQEYTFRMRVGDTLGISEAGQKAIAEIDAALMAKNFQAAIDAAKAALGKEAHSVLDYALMNQLLATAYSGLEDPFSALEAIKHATQSAVNMEGTREYMLTPELLEGALKQRLIRGERACGVQKRVRHRHHADAPRCLAGGPAAIGSALASPPEGSAPGTLVEYHCDNTAAIR